MVCAVYTNYICFIYHGVPLPEIGVFNSRGGVELPGITEPGDTVKGFLTLSDVAIICKKMQTFTGKEPVKVTQ